MRKFFTLNNQYVDVEIASSLAEVLDETMDNITVSLKANDVKDPYAPFTQFNLVEGNPEDSSTWKVLSPMKVSNDKVEIFSNAPLRYRHTISAIQNHEFLTKHLMRNTVFSADLTGSSGYSTNAITTCTFKDNALSWLTNVYGSPIRTDLRAIYTIEMQNKGTIAGVIDRNKVSFDSNFSFYIEFEAYQLKNATVEYTGQIYVPSLETNRLDGSTNNWDKISDVSYFKDNTTPRLQLTMKRKMGGVWADVDTRIINIENITHTNITSGDKLYLSEEDIAWLRTAQDNDLIEYEVINAVGKHSLLEIQDGVRITEGDSFPLTCLLIYKVNFTTPKLNLTIYKVLADILVQMQQKANNYGNDILFLLPTYTQHPTTEKERRRNELYRLLNETNAPSFVFTQSSVFDAVAEIFRMFDATFTIDEDNVLCIEYFNEHKKINKPDAAGRTSSLSEEKYADKLVSFFQNSQIEAKFPNTTEESTLTNVRSKSLGVPNENDYVFMLPKPIYMIKSVRINTSVLDVDIVSIPKYCGEYFVASQSINEYPAGYTTAIKIKADISKTIDITDYVVETSLYSTLNPTTVIPIDNDWSKKGMYNCLNYSQGSNYIECGGTYTNEYSVKNAILSNVIKSALHSKYGYNTIMYGTTNYPNWRNVKFAVEYIALVDGRITIESIEKKYNGSFISNQSNGSIDIYKLGLNMVGLSLKLGQPTLTMTQKYSNWENRVKKGEFFIDEDGNKWVANVCNYSIINSELIQTTIEFVKNFNSLATRIELNSEKRLTNISANLTQKCEDNYGEFIYYSTESPSYIIENIAYGSVSSVLHDAITRPFGLETSDYRVEYALITPLDEENRYYGFDGKKIRNIICPLTIYATGNSVCFEMGYDSPISAGNQLLTNYTGFWGSGYFSKPVLYCNEDGSARKFDISLVKITDGAISNYYPEFRNSDGTDIGFMNIGLLENYEYIKKPNEIFALNYQLHFLPTPNKIHKNFLGQAYIRNNGFINEKTNISFYLYYSNNEDDQYSILDIKGIGTQTLLRSIETNTFEDNYTQITFKWRSLITAKSWAICDKDRNIYFASNDGLESANQTSIYFFTRHNKL